MFFAVGRKCRFYCQNRGIDDTEQPSPLLKGRGRSLRSFGCSAYAADSAVSSPPESSSQSANNLDYCRAEKKEWERALESAIPKGVAPLSAIGNIRKELRLGFTRANDVLGGSVSPAAPFPLTPEEREPRWPRYEPAGTPDMRESGVASPSRLGRSLRSFGGSGDWGHLSIAR